MQPEIKCLTPGDIEKIHHGALQVLARTGVEMNYPRALEVFHAAGAVVSRSGGLVKLKDDLVERALATVPRRVRLSARGEQGHDMDVPQGGPYFGTWANSVRILDLDTGERRTATRRDLAQFIQVGDALEHFTWLQPMLSPQDVPKDKAYYYAWATALENTRKHLIGPAPGAEGVRVILEMCSVVAGGGASVGERPDTGRRPDISFGILTRPPLAWSGWSLGAIIAAAENGIPVYLGAGPVAGATGPVTLAGTLVQAHAELLAGIVLSQLVNPGHPVFYASSSRVMDMRTGSITLCSPEWFIFRICIRQMGKYLGLPVYTGGLFTDSKIPDAQSGFEKGFSAIAGVFGGDLIAGCTLETNKCADMGDLVIGNEIAGFARRVAGGVTGEQGWPGRPGQPLPWQHSLADRLTWDEWEAQGRQDLWRKARRTAREILTSEHRQQVAEDAKREIERIVEKAPDLVLD